MVTTNKRLNFIASFVEEGDIVGDIGSDHGYIPRYLNAIGHAYVYASDNKKGPYLRLKAATSKLEHGIIEVGLVDGIETLPTRVNTLILSGMGGALIKDILTAYPARLKNITKLILAPQGAVSELRGALNTIHFKIEEEALIHDDKYYEVIVAKRGNEVLNKHQMMFGPRHLETKSPLFIAKWNKELTRINTLLANDLLSKTRRQELESAAFSIGNALKEKR